MADQIDDAGVRDRSDAPSSAPSAAPSSARKDGLGPERQRAFLVALACEGYVDRACAIVGISREAVYAFRQRAAGAAFALGWDAALLVARVRVADMLMARAFEGQVDVSVRDADSGEWRRHRTDNRLALALLGRLDRFADAAPAREGDARHAHADARLIAQDWEAFLDLIEAGHEGSGAALFLAARREPEAAPPPALEPCQLRAENGPVEVPPPHDRHRVWGEPGAWRTNYPPSADYDGSESGSYGQRDYSRDLTDEEARLHYAAEVADLMPIIAAARAQRDEYFAECREIAEAEGIDIDSFTLDELDQ